MPTYVTGEVVIKKYHWYIEKRPITGHAGGTLTYSNGNYDAQSGFGYFVQNHISTLDELGEWYFDSAAEKFFMHFGVDAHQSHSVLVSILDASQFCSIKDDGGGIYLYSPGPGDTGREVMGNIVIGPGMTYPAGAPEDAGTNGIYKAPVGVASADDVLCYYNDTMADKNIILPADTYLDVGERSTPELSVWRHPRRWC